VEQNADNRGIEISAESEDFSGEVLSPKARRRQLPVRVQGLPGGEYEISVINGSGAFGQPAQKAHHLVPSER
jgi:hypothetical protein